MNEYSRLKENIQSRVQTLEQMITRLEQGELIQSGIGSRWRSHLNSVQSSLQDPLLRVAVVGSVKSGKSTLINALLGTDLLKRGAGIVTAFITRVLCDSQAGGWVELKDWSRISEELNAAVRLLPIFEESFQDSDRIDIRKEKDRGHLAQWLAATQSQWQQVRGQLDPSFVLLSAYLDGYAKLQELLGDRVNRLNFDGSSISQHQDFAGRESQAVYVQDMELHYAVPWLGKEVEIADCQGSDSPNPLHFALLQQHLLKSHFILYVISSRSGLREADLRLLDFIKTLRMFPQTFFVLNLDLDGHPDAEDLQESVDRVRKELGWMVSNPQLFACSALFHLLAQTDAGASTRDQQRLQAWRADPVISKLTETQFNAFKVRLTHRINDQRTRVLFGSGLSRLSMIAGSLLDQGRTQQAFLSRNLGDLKHSAKQLKARQRALQATLATLENAISGLRDTVRKELDDMVHTYFDLQTGPVIQDTLSTVANYPVDRKYLQNLHDPRYLLRQLHQFYLEFRQELSRYLVEKVNPEIIEFAKDQESALKERLQYSSKAFWSLFQTAMEDYRKELARYQIQLQSIDHEPDSGWSGWGEITPPAFSGFASDQALGRGLLLMKFGIGRLSRFLGSFKDRLGKRGSEEKISEREETLREAIQLVKSETRAELIYAFRDYRQNFKYQYLFRLLEQGAEYLIAEFKDRAEMAELDFAALLKQSAGEERRREQAAAVWAEIGDRTKAMVDELEQVRCALALEWVSPEADEPTGSEAERPESWQHP
jgi:hypothetical protein